MQMSTAAAHFASVFQLAGRQNRTPAIIPARLGGGTLLWIKSFGRTRPIFSTKMKEGR